MEIAAEKSVLTQKNFDRQLDFPDADGFTNSFPLLEQLKSPRKPKTEWHLPACPPRPPLRRPFKPASPTAQLHANTEVEDGTLKEQRHCKCKQSRCVKLYCECFASETYCDGCSCVNCQNNVDNEAAREVAIQMILQRKPNAFMPKIADTPNKTHDKEDEATTFMLVAKHNKGCHCKKTACLKRYCECFQANIACSKECKCMGCKNSDNCEERLALYNGRKNDFMTIIKQANAAITDAIGFSGYRSSGKRKRNNQDFFPFSTGEPICRLVEDLQIVGSTALTSSKMKYRSLLAGTIQQRDMRELCSTLVVVSEDFKISRFSTDQIDVVDLQTVKEKHTATFPANRQEANFQEGPEGHKATPSGSLGRDQVNKNGKCPGDADVQKGKPASPGTLALLSGEEDLLFTLDASSEQITNFGCKAGISVEQERLVMIQFRDFLNRLITRGNVKERRMLYLS